MARGVPLGKDICGRMNYRKRLDRVQLEQELGQTMPRINQLLPKEKLIDFCITWKIEELSVFGSILRDDFGPESDVDLLITFASEAEWSLFDHVRMQNELEALLGRGVDLLTRQAIEHSQNWIRRAEILNTAQIYIFTNEVLHATGRRRHF